MNNNTFSEKHVSTISVYFQSKYGIQLNQLREYVSLLSFRVNLSTNLFLSLNGRWRYVNFLRVFTNLYRKHKQQNCSCLRNYELLN